MYVCVYTCIMYIATCLCVFASMCECNYASFNVWMVEFMYVSVCESECVSSIEVACMSQCAETSLYSFSRRTSLRILSSSPASSRRESTLATAAHAPNVITMVTALIKPTHAIKFSAYIHTYTHTYIQCFKIVNTHEST